MHSCTVKKRFVFCFLFSVLQQLSFPCYQPGLVRSAAMMHRHRQSPYANIQLRFTTDNSLSDTASNNAHFFTKTKGKLHSTIKLTPAAQQYVQESETLKQLTGVTGDSSSNDANAAANLRFNLDTFNFTNANSNNNNSSNNSSSSMQQQQQ